MKYLYRFAGIYGAFILQFLFCEKLKIFSCSPDLVITILVICAVCMDCVQSAVLGAFAGLLTDVMFGSVFGLNLLKYMYVGIVVCVFADKRHFNSPLIMSWICFISVAAAEIATSVLRGLFGVEVSIGSLGANVFVKGVFAALFAMLFVLFKQRKSGKKNAKNKEVLQGKEALS